MWGPAPDPPTAWALTVEGSSGDSDTWVNAGSGGGGAPERTAWNQGFHSPQGLEWLMPAAG